MVLQNIENTYHELFPAEKKVADFIRRNADQVVEMNIADVAENSDTSEATVIRISKRLGYKGFYQLKIALAKEGIQRQLAGYHGSQDDPETVKYILRETARNIVNLSEKMVTVQPSIPRSQNRVCMRFCEGCTRQNAIFMRFVCIYGSTSLLCS